MCTPCKAFFNKTQKNREQSPIDSVVRRNPTEFQFKYSRIRQPIQPNESVDSFGRSGDFNKNAKEAHIENGEEVHQSWKSPLLIGKPQMGSRIDVDAGSRDAVEWTSDNSVQLVDYFAASDPATECTRPEERFCQSRNKFDQKMTLDKVMLPENIDCSKDPERDSDKLEVSLKHWESELDKDVFPSGGRNDLMNTPKVEGTTHKNNYSRDMMLLLANPSSDISSEGRPGTQDEFRDSDERYVDSKTSSVEAENSFIYPANPEEVDRKGKVQISEFPPAKRGSFKGVRTVSVNRLPEETLGLRLGVHSFIDQGEERVERVVVNEVTPGGAASRAGQDICTGDEIVSINNTVFYELRLENVMNFLKEIPLKVTLLVRRGKRSPPPFPSSLNDTSPQEFRPTQWNSLKGLTSLMNPVAKMFTDDSEESETPEENSFDLNKSSNSYSAIFHADDVDDDGAFKKKTGNWHFDSKYSTYQTAKNTDLSVTSANYSMDQNWFPGRTFPPSSLTDSDPLDKSEASGNRQQRTNEINAKEPLSTNVGLLRTDKTLSSAKCVGFPGSRGRTRFWREFLGTIEETPSTEEGEQDYVKGEGPLQGRSPFSEPVLKQPVTRVINQEISGLPDEKEGAIADNFGNGSGSLDDGFEDDDVILEENTEIRYSQAPTLYDRQTSLLPSCPTGYDKANLSTARNRNEHDDRRSSDEEGILFREKLSFRKEEPEESGICGEYVKGDDKVFDKSEQILSVNCAKQDSLAQIESVTDNSIEDKRQCASSLGGKLASKQWSYEQWSTGRVSFESITADTTKRNKKTEKYCRAESLEKKDDTEKDIKSEKNNGDHFKDERIDNSQDRDRWLVRLPPSCSRDPDQPVPKDLGSLSIQSPNFPAVPERRLPNSTPGPTFQPPNSHSGISAERMNSPTEYKTPARPVSDPLPDSSHNQMRAFYFDEAKPSKADLKMDFRKHVSMNSFKPHFQEKIKIQRPARSAYEILARFVDDSEVTSGMLSQEKRKLVGEDEEDMMSPPPLPSTAPPDFPVSNDTNFP